MRTDCVDGCSALPHEQSSRAMKHQDGLLITSLGWHEPHIRPHDRFANSFRIGLIVLLALNIRLDVPWRD